MKSSHSIKLLNNKNEPCNHYKAFLIVVNYVYLTLSMCGGSSRKNVDCFLSFNLVEKLLTSRFTPSFFAIDKLAAGPSQTSDIVLAPIPNVFQLFIFWDEKQTVTIVPLHCNQSMNKRERFLSICTHHK